MTKVRFESPFGKPRGGGGGERIGGRGGGEDLGDGRGSSSKRRLPCPSIRQVDVEPPDPLVAHNGLGRRQLGPIDHFWRGAWGGEGGRLESHERGVGVDFLGVGHVDRGDDLVREEPRAVS